MNRKVLWWVWFCFLSVFPWQNAWAEQQRNTRFFLEKARSAWSIPDYKLWHGAMKDAERVFQQEKAKLPVEQKNNLQLWLYFLWAKYYQYQGVPPEIRQVSDFKSKEELDRYIELLGIRIKNLDQSASYFNEYNKMFLQLSVQNNLRNRIELEASRRLEGDLKNSRDTLLVYRAFLASESMRWREKSKPPRPSGDFSKQRAIIQKLERNQQALMQRQKKLARVVLLAHQGYLKNQRRLQNKQTRSRWLMTSGSIVAAIGVGVMAGMLVHRNYILSDEYKTNVLNPMRDRGEIANVATYQQEQSNLYLGIAVGMAVIGGTGLVLLITGAVTYPSLQEKEQEVLKSHGDYLRPSPRSSSLSPPRTRFFYARTPREMRRNMPHLPHTATAILGTWQ